MSRSAANTMVLHLHSKKNLSCKKTTHYVIENLDFIPGKIKWSVKFVCIHFPIYQRAQVAFWLRRIYVRNQRTLLGYLISYIFTNFELLF